MVVYSFSHYLVRKEYYKLRGPQEKLGRPENEKQIFYLASDSIIFQ